MIDVKAIPRRAPVGERSALVSAIAGLAVTMRHFFRNLFGQRGVETRRYPEEKPPYPPRFRGEHRLMLRPDGSLRCVACMLCPTVCPAHCITVIAEETDDADEKRARVFEIDELRCVVCGLCVEVCPVDAIRMDTGVHLPVVRRRGELVFDAERLRLLAAQSVVKRVGGRPALEGSRVTFEEEGGEESHPP